MKTVQTTFISFIFLASCAVTGQPTEPARLGKAVSYADMLATLAAPGPVVLETVVSATWQVPRSGLINLDHPAARAANLEDGDEPIHVAFHVLHHPEHGMFMVDTGVEAAWESTTDDHEPDVSWLVQSVMNTDALHVQQSAGAWLARQEAPLAGILLTHLHLDHIMGLPDLPASTPIYIGPGEAEHSGFEAMFVRGTYDAMLNGFGPLREWPYQNAQAQPFAGIVDIFSDGSVYALATPGHTPGNTSYLVRTPDGPVLLLGDACHTAWGWRHGVEPGTFSYDQKTSTESLAALKQLAADTSFARIVPGHQTLADSASTMADNRSGGDAKRQ